MHTHVHQEHVCKLSVVVFAKRLLFRLRVTMLREDPLRNVWCAISLFLTFRQA